MNPRLETVYFGSGPFRSKASLFAQLHGVCETHVGYMGGWAIDPSEVNASSGMSGHTEVVEVTFDTNQTKFSALLKAFFSFHDATHAREEKGGLYRSIVFCRKAKQKIVTERAIALLRQHGLEVVTQVKDATVFWVADTDQQTRFALARPVGAEPTVAPETLSLLQAAKQYAGEQLQVAP